LKEGFYSVINARVWKHTNQRWSCNFINSQNP
jgi:hypothetical protein